MKKESIENQAITAVLLFIILTGLFCAGTIKRTSEIVPIEISREETLKSAGSPLKEENATQFKEENRTQGGNGAAAQPGKTALAEFGKPAHTQFGQSAATQFGKSAPAYTKNADIVSFNPNSMKYHKEYCEWAKKCKRCIKIPRQEAIKRGGKPCKICGKRG